MYSFLKNLLNFKLKQTAEGWHPQHCYPSSLPSSWCQSSLKALSSSLQGQLAPTASHTLCWLQAGSSGAAARHLAALSFLESLGCLGHLCGSFWSLPPFFQSEDAFFLPSRKAPLSVSTSCFDLKCMPLPPCTPQGGQTLREVGVDWVGCL